MRMFYVFVCVFVSGIFSTQAFADVHQVMELTEALVGEAVARANAGTAVVYQDEPLNFAPQ